MERINFQGTELSREELLSIEGGRWYEIYQILSREMKDFVRGFKDGHDA